MKPKNALYMLSTLSLKDMTLPTRAIAPSPWDKAVFGVDTYEVKDLSIATLEYVKCTPGHYTIRVNPLESKQLLQEYGFYYCDTLIEPYCKCGEFQGYYDDDFSIDKNVHIEALLGVCHGAFIHGRFHRDFNLNPYLADIRYDKWLVQLYEAGAVWGLLHKEEITGFIAVDGNKLVLHAVSESMRGKGLAKFLWTPMCMDLFKKGMKEITSSISASNLAVLNLYASLGFRFRNPVDIYHRLTQ